MNQTVELSLDKNWLDKIEGAEALRGYEVAIERLFTISQDYGVNEELFGKALSEALRQRNNLDEFFHALIRNTQNMMYNQETTCFLRSQNIDMVC